MDRFPVEAQMRDVTDDGKVAGNDGMLTANDARHMTHYARKNRKSIVIGNQV